MAVDTFMAYVGMYPDVADAEADYQLVKDLHTEAGLIDAYDAAVVERRADGKVRITRKHETPTRVGGVLGGGVGLATGLVVALFPFAAIGAGLLAATTAGGAVLGAVAGHAAAGMSRPTTSRSWVSSSTPARPAWSWSASPTWAPRSSGPCATPRRSRPSSSRLTRRRSRPTPRAPATRGCRVPGRGRATAQR